MPRALTLDNVDELYEQVFAPWVKASGLRNFQVERGRVAAVLPISPEIVFSRGNICGQAMASAADTLIAMAMISMDTGRRGTSYLHTHFLRPGTEDLIVEAEVLRAGSTTAYAECHLRLASSGKLAAHAVAEFAC